MKNTYTTITIENAIYTELKERYNKSLITKEELAFELSCSVSAINNYICKGYGIPEYKKVGPAKNAPVLFPIACVASFLSQTIRVAA